MPLVEYLVERRHTVDFAADLPLAQRLASSGRFDVVTLGQAPGAACASALLRLRQSFRMPVPVLVLGTRGVSRPCESGEAGPPDGYLPAPYTLHAVDGMLAVLRRRGRDHRPVLKVGQLEMTVMSPRIECCGTEVHMERTPLSLLRILMEAWPRPVAYQELASCVSSDAGNSSLMVMREQMDMLRNALLQVDGAPMLQQRQTGYRLVLEDPGRH